MGYGVTPPGAVPPNFGGSLPPYDIQPWSNTSWTDPQGKIGSEGLQYLLNSWTSSSISSATATNYLEGIKGALYSFVVVGAGNSSWGRDGSSAGYVALKGALDTLYGGATPPGQTELTTFLKIFQTPANVPTLNLPHDYTGYCEAMYTSLGSTLSLLTSIIPDVDGNVTMPQSTLDGLSALGAILHTFTNGSDGNTQMIFSSQQIQSLNFYCDENPDNTGIVPQFLLTFINGGTTQPYTMLDTLIHETTSLWQGFDTFS